MVSIDAVDGLSSSCSKIFPCVDTTFDVEDELNRDTIDLIVSDDDGCEGDGSE